MLERTDAANFKSQGWLMGKTTPAAVATATQHLASQGLHELREHANDVACRQYRALLEAMEKFKMDGNSQQLNEQFLLWKAAAERRITAYE